ncbi:MAG: NAD-dependent epimerase/dehydratase family protein [Chloroflexales bacterium]|nr:NAD-dependent epimerase/dehydratase family protein [Chloroflexales bacterium]
MDTQELHVVFGTGPLGLATARELLAKGKAVRMVNRSGRGEAPKGATLVRGDAYDAKVVAELCAGASVVYQCAQPAYTEWVTKFPPLQASIIEGVARSGAKLVVVENLYMYGPHEGPLREDLPYAATTRKGRVRAQIAESLMAAHRSGTVRATAGRGSNFYGPHVLGSTVGERTFGPMLQGKAAQAIGNIDMPHTYTYIEDFGRALVTLGEHDEALGQAWHVPNPPALTTRQFLNIAFEQLGRKAAVQAMGRLMLTIGGIFVPEARESIEMLYEFDEPLLVDHSKFESAFGASVTPHNEGIRRTLAWYRAHLGEKAVVQPA